MFSNAIKVFTINDFDIRVDPSWLIIASLVTWSLSQWHFPEVIPGLSGGAYLVMAVVAMLGLFGSLLLHELAHSVVARRFGVPIKKITLFLFGGVAELEAEPTSARVELLVAIAGPVMSVALAIAFWTLAQIAYVSGLSMAVVEVIAYLALINLILALFNLIPAFPLDGGRILRAYLWHRSGDALAATRTASTSGTIFAYFLMAMGIMTLFQGGVVAGFWYPLIGLFVLVAARSSYANQLAQTAFEGKTVGGMMSRNPITVGPEVTLARLVNQVMLTHGVSFLPVIEDGVLLGYIDRSVLSRIDRENWASTRVGDVFVGMEDSVMVPPDMQIQDLFARIQADGHRKFMVVRDHELLGVITLSDLTGHLSQASAHPVRQ